MGFDRNGQLHAGSIGLFDDPDEYESTQTRFRRCHAQRLQWAHEQAQIYDDREHLKAAKKNQRRHDKEIRASWLDRLLRKKSLKVELSKLPTSGSWAPKAESSSIRKEENAEYEDDSDSETVVEDSLEMYDASQVDDELDSPFYAALGLVRIKADRGADVRIVCASQIRPTKGS